MAQQFDSPKTETQLRELQDKLYQHSKEVYDAGREASVQGTSGNHVSRSNRYHSNSQHQKQSRQ